MYPIPLPASAQHLPNSQSERNLRKSPEAWFRRQREKNASRYSIASTRDFSIGCVFGRVRIEIGGACIERNLELIAENAFGQGQPEAIGDGCGYHSSATILRTLSMCGNALSTLRIGIFG
jgi:hypothetical protein